MKVWKYDTIEDATVIEKAVKANKSKTINNCWRKLCADVVPDFTGFTRANQGHHERDCGYGNMWRMKGFKLWIVEEFKKS